MTTSKTPARPPATSKTPKGGKKRPKPPPRETSASRLVVFLEHYIATGNGTEAARAAGYRGTEAHLANQAWRLLRKAEVKEALGVRIKDLAGSAGAQEVQLRLWRAAAYDLADLLVEELVVDYLAPGDKGVIVTLPADVPPPDGLRRLRGYTRVVPDLLKAKAKGVTAQIKGVTFYPDGSVKSLSLEDRAGALDKLLRITRVLEPDADPARSLALALQQAFGAGVQAAGAAKAAAWRAGLHDGEGG